MNRATVLALIDQLRATGVQPTGVQADSRRVQVGDVFVAWPGARTDGRSRLAEAVERGAVAVLWENADGFVAADLPVPSFGVPGLQALSGHLAHELSGRPSASLWVAGVTGTNGKTTVSQWIAQALKALDVRCGVIGTIGAGEPGRLVPLANTTPDAVALHRLLADFRVEGVSAVAMEVSSIGLEQGRVNGVEFDVALFTNLSRDHLDHHGTMEAYAAAKARLFDMPGLKHAVINLDDAFGATEAARAAKRGLRVIGYTVAAAVTFANVRVLSATEIDAAGAGVRFTACFEGERAGVTLQAVGLFNVSNALAAIGALLVRGVSLADAARAAGSLVPPPGRMQCFGGEAAPLVVVDYAHTPDALAKVLEAMRVTAGQRGGQVVCVFGCGGDRDAGKRPLMGQAAAQFADRVIVTSDNPRGESPQAIADAVLAGAGAKAESELDRARAILRAITEAAAHDVVVVAGKGHEPYQEIRGERLPFSDAEQVAAALRARGAHVGAMA